MEQNTENRTYITIGMHKHKNKITHLKKLTRSIQNIQPHTKHACFHKRCAVSSVVEATVDYEVYSSSSYRES